GERGPPVPDALAQQAADAAPAAGDPHRGHHNPSLRADMIPAAHVYPRNGLLCGVTRGSQCPVGRRSAKRALLQAAASAGGSSLAIQWEITCAVIGAMRMPVR